VPDAFYEPLDDGRYRSTVLTRGPWDPRAQHAGPPSALLGGALGSALGSTLDGPVVRITLEILRPVPIADLTVTTELLRPGRKVALAQGVLSDDEGPVMLARAWAIRSEELALPAEVRAGPDAIPGPGEASAKPFFLGAADVGYHTAMDVRFVKGGFTEPGPAVVWMRPRQPVVAGTELTPLQRVLCAADSGNGVSAWFDAESWLFINTDLTVHLHRHPTGEWVSLDAHTVLEPDGFGLAQSVLRDETGVIGRSLQSLLVAHTT
jgi:hypothetical protein